MTTRPVVRESAPTEPSGGPPGDRASEDAARSPRALHRLFGLRTRLVTWFGLFLLLTLVVSLLAARWVLLVRLDGRIDDALVQEAEKLRALSRQPDPETGQPLGADVRRLFDVYLSNNVPIQSEALITYVDGAPYLRSSPVVPHRLDRDPELTARRARLDRTERSVVETVAGPVEYLAVPVRQDGQTQGVYVGAIFRGLERAEVDDVLQALGAVGLVLVLVGCVLAVSLSNSILRPVAQATTAARRISETDLTRPSPPRAATRSRRWPPP